MTPRWQGLDPLAGLTLHATAAFDQRGWRFRNDDGSQTAATWKAAANTAISQDSGVPFRVRFEVQETGGGSANNQTLQLQFQVNTGTWTTVPDSGGPVHMEASAHVADQTATTNQLTAGTGAFVAGTVQTGATNGSNTTFAGNDHTEHEWCLQLDGSQLTNGDTVRFRVTINSALANTSTAGNASLTANVPIPSFEGNVSWTEESDGFAAAEHIWGDETDFTGITQTNYLDTTVTNGVYRYRVAEADSGAAISDFTDWGYVEVTLTGSGHAGTASWTEQPDGVAASATHSEGGDGTLIDTTFSGTNGDPWPAPWTVGGGTASIQDNRGRVLKTTTAWSGGFVEANLDITRTRVRGTMLVHDVAQNSFQQVAVRVTDSFNYFSAEFFPPGGAWDLKSWVGGSDTPLGSHTMPTVSNGTIVWFEMVADGSTVTFKTWRQVDSEPETPQITATNRTEHASGDVRFIINSGNAAADYMDIDSVTVDDLSGPVGPDHEGAVAWTEEADGVAASAAHAPPEFTATAAWTEQTDGVAASATHAPPQLGGTVVWTEEDDGVAASATHVPPVGSGTAAWTEEADGIAASATHTPPVGSGTVAWTEEDDGIAASGTVVDVDQYGEGSTVEVAGVDVGAGANGFWAEEADSLAASASHTPPVFTGTASWTEQTDGVDSSASHQPPEFSGVGTVAEQADELAGTATFTPPVFTGDASWTEEQDGVSASASFSIPDRTGAISWTEEPDDTVVSATYQLPEGQASVSWTEEPDGVAISATHTPPTYSADATWTEQADGIAASGAHAPPVGAGTAAWTEEPDGIAASATHVAPTFTATGALTEESDGWALAGAFELAMELVSVGIATEGETALTLNVVNPRSYGLELALEAELALGVTPSVFSSGVRKLRAGDQLVLDAKKGDQQIIAIYRGDTLFWSVDS